MTPAMTVGGIPLYHQAPNLQGLLGGGATVYRPERGDLTGLFSNADDEEIARTAINQLGGGLLNGVVYNPNAGLGERMLQPISPSGMYTSDESQAAPVVENNKPERGLTFGDAIQFMYGPAGDTALGGQQAMVSNLLRGDDTRFVDIKDTYDPTSDDWQNLLNYMRNFAGPKDGE